MPDHVAFVDSLGMSYGVCADNDVSGILLGHIPGALSVTQASRRDDRNGTDYWVTIENENVVSVDVKARWEDWAARGEDDLALETWSVVELEVIGWTRDPKKRTDYILWLWRDTKRWCLVPFRLLCAVFMRRWVEWRRTHRTAVQTTAHNGRVWRSECVFVPRREVWAAIYLDFAGAPGQAAVIPLRDVPMVDAYPALDNDGRLF